MKVFVFNMKTGTYISRLKFVVLLQFSLSWGRSSTFLLPRKLKDLIQREVKGNHIFVAELLKYLHASRSVESVLWWKVCAQWTAPSVIVPFFTSRHFRTYRSKSCVPLLQAGARSSRSSSVCLHDQLIVGSVLNRDVIRGLGFACMAVEHASESISYVFEGLK